MLSRVLLVFTFFFFSSCQLLQEIAGSSVSRVSNQEIAKALKEALRQGVEYKVSLLAKSGGYFSNPAVRIDLPEELKIVERKLVTVGLGNLTDEGIKLLNSAAEDAVGEATNIFFDAITNMTLTDAMTILKGNDSAATKYLKDVSDQKLYDAFHPQIKLSLDKVGANQVWKSIASKYNVIPFVKKIDPQLDDYVTKAALQGVYTMIAQQELKIRSDISARNTDLLRKVFALQDK